jgi:3-oxoacyl-[acyl-carrier-protein] synthase-3
MDPQQTVSKRVAILGQGHALPDHIRTNDDPIFDWLKKHEPSGSDIFTGLKYRRVLAHANDVVGIMAKSCKTALDMAKVPLDQVDLLLGSATVSEYYAPNALAAVHRELGLPNRCRILALNTDESNFIDGMKVANDMVTCGTARHALVACGNNWTHHMDYHEPVSLAASDGAGAAVLGWTDDATRFSLLDWDNDTQTQYYTALRMAQRPSPHHRDLFTKPLMKLDDKTGENAVKTFGFKMPGVVVNRLLARHGLTGQDITLVAHQTSKAVFDAWNAAIQPAHYLNTIEELGDMVASSVPVNFARSFDEIKTRYVVMLGIGMEMHAVALLYQRG